jgi:SpoIID/LytB domain protein
MKISVGLMEGREAVDVELKGSYSDAKGSMVGPGQHRFTSGTVLTPVDSAASFEIKDVTIGVGFHWERQERQAFRGALRLLNASGLTVINDVELEEYVTSVISSEMSASCPLELLKAHAVISRSWLMYPKANPQVRGAGHASMEKPDEIIRWYGREAHADFDVCADDHCQRYQGITKAFSRSAEQAVRETAGEMLMYGGNICDARFYKCCGGRTEDYSVAWDDQRIPYLVAIWDTPKHDPQAVPYCDTNDAKLLSEILPNFDQETRDFYRWRVEYDAEDLREIIKTREGIDLGRVTDLQPLSRGVSGRIYRLKLVGTNRSLIVGKELEIRRALSRSHLYSSAFEIEKTGHGFVLNGSGWGHGVGLCQIGAAVMASQGIGYREILAHYYPGTAIGTTPPRSAYGT